MSALIDTVLIWVGFEAAFAFFMLVGSAAVAAITVEHVLEVDDE